MQCNLYYPYSKNEIPAILQSLPRFLFSPLLNRHTAVGWMHYCSSQSTIPTMQNNKMKCDSLKNYWIKKKWNDLFMYNILRICNIILYMYFKSMFYGFQWKKSETDTAYLALSLCCFKTLCEPVNGFCFVQQRLLWFPQNSVQLESNFL